MIDVTNYKKLKFLITATNNGNFIEASESSGYAIGLGKIHIVESDVIRAQFQHSKLVNDEGELIEIELDIEDYEGEYFIGLKTGRFLLKIHKIWLE